MAGTPSCDPSSRALNRALTRSIFKRPALCSSSSAARGHFTAEFETGVDYGAWLDGQASDPEMQSWFATAFGKDAPADLIASTILNEVQVF